MPVICALVSYGARIHDEAPTVLYLMLKSQILVERKAYSTTANASEIHKLMERPNPLARLCVERSIWLPLGWNGSFRDTEWLL